MPGDQTGEFKATCAIELPDDFTGFALADMRHIELVVLQPCNGPHNP
jgi:hypothetical protein